VTGQVRAMTETRIVASAAGTARTECGWLVGHFALTALVGWFAWHGVAGVWPALLWVLVGALAGDTVMVGRSVVCAVGQWVRVHRSGAYRAFRVALDVAEQQAHEVYRHARRVERTGAGGPGVSA
jgi:membrane protein DedA with SNARE-associated domain